MGGGWFSKEPAGGEKVVTETMLAAAVPFLALRDRVVFEQRCRVA